MNLQKIRELLEIQQIIIYFSAIILAITLAFLMPGSTAVLEPTINPALGFMLFVTFLQVPIADMKQSLVQARFLVVLLIVNFIIVPLLAAFLIQFLPSNLVMVRLGVLLVLLTPCIDYVVTFSHLGKADARILLVSTPILLILQMGLLPLYLSILLDDEAAHLIHPEPFIQAFIWLIAIPFILAIVMQLWATRKPMGTRIVTVLGLMPVPATALVLFLVIAAVAPQLGFAIDLVLKVIPIYIFFSVVAPLIGWFIARMMRLDVPASRSVAFSAGTRNSLVILPLALSIPGAIPVLPAIIVTQTLIELISELIYVRLIPKFTNRNLK